MGANDNLPFGAGQRDLTPWPADGRAIGPNFQQQVRRVTYTAPGLPTATQSAPVINPHAYAEPQSVAFDLPALGSPALLVLARSAGFRNLLLLRNASPGTESIYINFGNQATVDSPFLLPVGAMIILDTVVPQNDVYAIGSAATARLVIASSILTG